MMDFESTADIKIPSDPFERIIGQEEAVRVAKLAAKQRRHLLLVGPPGTGKSMIAHAIASILPKPQQEIVIVHNPHQPERPFVEIHNISEKNKEHEEQQIEKMGKIVDVDQVPIFVAEKFGLRCQRCGGKSDYTEIVCPICGADKITLNDDFTTNPVIMTVRRTPDNRQEQVAYERTIDGKIIMLTESDLKKRDELNAKKQRKVLIPFNRSLFVQASGGSETELLGDVRHDPYGGQPPLGVPPYLRVLPGAIHEAHEGVLYIDELATLGHLQKHLLTAMQDKSFPITGRNPTSSGAAVRVDGVPCDFILVGSVNITDLQMIIPSLRSRIRGNGYEVLMLHAMEDKEENRNKIVQFVAQEIINDGKIPHADKSAVEEIIKEGKRIAKKIDGVNGITLRLRMLSGIIKLAGDIAVAEGEKLITKSHVCAAIKNAVDVEEKIEMVYGSLWKATQADYGTRSPTAGPETA
jgi:predicted ATP-dependent protease